MNILILGAAGFIGTNLAIELSKDTSNRITLVDKKRQYFNPDVMADNVEIVESTLDIGMDYSIFANKDVVYHLVSTNMPTTSNQHISRDIEANVLFSSYLFDACVEYGVRKIAFMSSGGTVYGKDAICPISEEAPTNPISSYGVQKITIEKLLYLYNYMYGLDYRIIRLANPYGPYQRPNGILGAVTTFAYKALKGSEITVYGNGSVVRDFIYIDDAVRGILNIVNGDARFHTFNLGCGYGTSIREVLDTIEETLGLELNVVYKTGRSVDVPVNYLDINRYEKSYGKLNPTTLENGIKKTVEFMKRKKM